MADIIRNEFTQYNFNREDHIMAYAFSEVQEMGLHNMLAEVAAEKLNLTPAGGTREFELSNEYLRGKMDAIKGLLEVSRLIREEADQRLAAELANQPQFNLGK